MKAARLCYRGVGWKRQPQLFMNSLLTNCRALQLELQSGEYEPRPVKRFKINERGKERVIKPVNFRDRVVQRCLCDNVLVPAIEQNIIVDNSACLKGRGLSYAYERGREHIANTPMDGWYVQYDLHDYFHTINMEILTMELGAIIDDKDILEVIETIIKSDEGGLELGSHVSQICAMFYPTPMDIALRGVEGVTGYHRYMDDGLVLCKDKQTAINVMDRLKQCCSSLCLTLNEKKCFINRATHPIVFCKMRFHKRSDTLVKMNMRKKQTRRSVRHARVVRELAEAHPEYEIDMQPVYASFLGYVNKGDADLTRLLERVIE